MNAFGINNMAKRIAKFEKVSFDQFYESIKSIFYGEISEEKVEEIYDNIQLPVRSTKGSAGYDFRSTLSFTLNPYQTMTIPTGIRVNMENDWVLKMYPRSGLGFKYRIQLDNTVGIVDSDYYYSDNEGHIFIKITNDSKESKFVKFKEGDKFAQGVFVEYGITVDDDATEIRNGGFGSTGK